MNPILHTDPQDHGRLHFVFLLQTGSTASHCHMQSSMAQCGKMCQNIVKDKQAKCTAMHPSRIKTKANSMVQNLKLVNFFYILIMHDHKWMCQFVESEMRRVGLSQFVLYLRSSNIAQWKKGFTDIPAVQYNTATLYHQINNHTRLQKAYIEESPGGNFHYAGIQGRASDLGHNFRSAGIPVAPNFISFVFQCMQIVSFWYLYWSKLICFVNHFLSYTY